MRQRGLICALSLSAACVATPLGIGGDTYQGGNAAVNTAVAIGAAAQRGAKGGCVATCSTGSACNPSTGDCEALPCGGVCRDDERCNEDNIVPFCEVTSVFDPSRGTSSSPPSARLFSPTRSTP